MGCFVGWCRGIGSTRTGGIVSCDGSACCGSGPIMAVALARGVGERERQRSRRRCCRSLGLSTLVPVESFGGRFRRRRPACGSLSFLVGEEDMVPVRAGSEQGARGR